MIIGFIKFLLKLLAIGLIICAIDMTVTLDGVDLSPKAYGAETEAEADVYETGMEYQGAELGNIPAGLAVSCIDGTGSDGLMVLCKNEAEADDNGVIRTAGRSGSAAVTAGKITAEAAAESDDSGVLQAAGENKSAVIKAAEVATAAAAEAAYAVMDYNTSADSGVKDSAEISEEEILTESAVEETMSTHVHTWKELTGVIHYEAVTKQVWIVDKAAWDETVTTEVPVYGERLVIVATCRGCGAQFTGYNQDEVDRAAHRHIIDVHGNACGYGHEDSYREQYQTGTETQAETVHHEEEGHYETVTVSKAYDEMVVKGYVCTECGKIR